MRGLLPRRLRRRGWYRLTWRRWRNARSGLQRLVRLRLHLVGGLLADQAIGYSDRQGDGDDRSDDRLREFALHRRSLISHAHRTFASEGHDAARCRRPSTGKSPGLLPPCFRGSVETTRAARRQPLSRSKDWMNWSGRRDSNPRPQPWQGCALPLSYTRSQCWSAGNSRARRPRRRSLNTIPTGVASALREDFSAPSVLTRGRRAEGRRGSRAGAPPSRGWSRRGARPGRRRRRPRSRGRAASRRAP